MQILQKVLIVHFCLAYLNKLRGIGMNVGQHVNFQPSLLLAFVFGIAAHPFHDVGK
jgi:hypothetical protein